jgi:hypothetical protein
LQQPVIRCERAPLAAPPFGGKTGASGKEGAVCRYLSSFWRPDRGRG